MSVWMGHARTRVPRFADAAVERARLSVVPRARTGARRVPFVIMVSLVLLGGVVGLLLFNTSMQQSSFVATTLEQRAAVLHAKEQQLRMQLDELRNPQRVALAAQRLGMVPVRNPAFIRLSDGEVLGTPTVATAADGLRLTPRPSRRPAALAPPPVVAPPVDFTAGTDSGGGNEPAARGANAGAGATPNQGEGDGAASSGEDRGAGRTGTRD